MAVTLALLVAACGPEASPVDEGERPALEAVAIERGLVRDPDNDAPGGLYVRDTDHICVVSDGAQNIIGVHVDYGDGIACSARGMLVRSGSVWNVDMGDDCRFAVTVEPDMIAFPATLPDVCRRHCSSRASLASVRAERVSTSEAEARAMRDGRGRYHCAVKT